MPLIGHCRKRSFVCLLTRTRSRIAFLWREHG
jgi:hypothetical protein